MIVQPCHSEAQADESHTIKRTSPRITKIRTDVLILVILGENSH